MLSRNFRLQKVGNLQWLQKNYDFSQISFFIDELIVLNVSREEKKIHDFCQVLQSLTEGCFVPIAAGGGIRSIGDASLLLRSGADKIVINTPIYSDPELVCNLASEFGQQCVVGSMDIKTSENSDYNVWIKNGNECLNVSVPDWLLKVAQEPVGEIYFNSIDRDGTGQGYDLALLDFLPETITKPVILAGGVGNSKHLAQGLFDKRVDAVATAHLFNFIGDGLKKARQNLVNEGFDLPSWLDKSFVEDIKN